MGVDRNAAGPRLKARLGGVQSGRTLTRLRRLTPHQALGLLPYTAALAAATSVAMVTVKARRQPGFADAGIVTALAAAVVFAALLVTVRLRRRPFVVPSWLDARGFVAWALGLQLGLLLLPIPVLALVKGVAADDVHWTWPFLNKRWLIALYLLSIGTFVVFPVVVDWWQSGPVMEAPGSDKVSTAGRPHRRRWRDRIGGVLVVVAIAWFFAGPPWHLARHHRDIEMHEQVHLGPLQAISKGYRPYLGPASTQYGPGSQVLLYQAMRLSGHFDIVSFRAAWAAFNFAALLAVAVAACWWLGLASAAAVVVLAVTYSPLAFYGTAPDGTFAGFYGWANALRYIAPVLIVPALVSASGVGRSGTPWRSGWVVLLGILWGAASWVSQENLSSTGLAAGLLLVLLCGTRSMPVSRAVRIARDLLGGFAIAVAPVLVDYAMRGELGTFVGHYFVVPRAVAAGFSNTWWPRQDTAGRTFYAVPAFVLALAVASLWRLPALMRQEPLDRRRALLLAFLSVQLACYQVALLRSDAAHLQNTMLAMPFILVLGAQDLPRWLATPSLSRRTIRWIFVVVALAILPSGKLRMWRQILVTPFTRFTSARGVPVPIVADPRIAYARATPLLTDEPAISPTLSMRQFLDFATGIHALAGGRPTYVGDYSDVLSGPLYFLADLTPAPYLLDRETMILNDTMRAQVVEHIRSHPADYGAYVGDSLEAPEARAFLAGHADARRVERTLGSRTVHILLAPNPDARQRF